MRLYLVQHGEARSEAEDPTRPLMEKGRTEVRRVAAGAQNLAVSPVKILHSGKLRAQQTAELFAEALHPSKGIEAASGLSPNDPVQPWRERLNQQDADFMLVGHLPHLHRLASLLLCGDERAEIIRFRYAAVVCLEREGTRWAVQWILTPDMS